MKKTLLLFAFLWLTVGYAQDKRVITGTVLDGVENFGLPGATIILESQSISNETPQKGIIESASVGTVTDFDGNFSLEVPINAKTILVSFMGYESQVVKLEGKSHYTIKLTTDDGVLEEVVLTGYQAIEKRKLTSAVGQVNMKEIQQVGVSSIDQMLSGQIAGVSVAPQTGAPGGPAKIRIRGTASLNGPQDPLWVIDGLPLEGNDVPDFSDKDNIDQLENFSIAGLNPDDIEDITILKDAAATAIYGARAANGVIAITTKKGKKGDMRINFSANTFVTQKPDFSKLNLLDASQKVDLELMLAGRTDLNYRSDKGEVARILNSSGELEAFQNGGFDALSSETQDMINALRSRNTNWGDLLYQTAINQQYGLSISGGNDRSDYYFSLGYYDEEGSTIGTGFERYNITLKNNYALTDKLNVGVALFGTQSDKTSFVSDRDASINPANYSRNANPYMSPYLEDGSYNYDKDIDGFDDRYIPFNFLEERENTSYDLRNRSLKAVFDIDYSILEDLKISSQLGLQIDNSEMEKFLGKDTYNVRKERERTRRYKDGDYYYFLPDGGIIENDNNNYFQYNWKTQATYNTIFNNLHELDVMVGSEIRRTKNNIIRTKGFGYDPKTLTTKPILFPSESEAKDKNYETFKKSSIENAYASFFATASYTFDRKYTVFGSVRYDGSNLFGVDPKYKYLPLWAISGSWLVTNEEFMHDIEFISNLRLRASYGLQGNIDRNTSPFVIGEYSNTTLLPGVDETTIVVTNPPNSKLRWEKTSNTNVGIDLGLFRNRIALELDVYNRRSTDLIGLRELPLENGFEYTNMNWAQVSNKGYEISLTTRNIDKENFKWNTNFNFSHNKSNIDQVEVMNSSILPSGQGYAVNAVFGFKTAGIDEYGNPLFWLDGEKVSTVEFFDLSDPYAEIIPGELTVHGLTNEEMRSRFEYLGDRDPKFIGGIINNFKIHNFDVSISAAFNLKQTVTKTPPYNGAEVDPGRNYTADILNAWSPTNTSSNLPGIIGKDMEAGDSWMAHSWFGGADPYNTYRYLDIWAKEISYLRISSIRVGYTLPNSITDKFKIQQARVSLEGNNLFVFGSDYSGYFDPETYGNIYAQPISKSFTVGLNLTL